MTPIEPVASHHFPPMHTQAIVLEAPERLVLSRLDLEPPGEADAVVDI
jgi:hypothetical protein